MFEFAYETQVEASLAANSRLDHEAYIAAKSAVASGAGMLVADLLTNSSPDVDVSQGTVTGKQYDGLDEEWPRGVPYQQINDSLMQCNISDEVGKISLYAVAEYLRSDRDNQPNENGAVLIEALNWLFEEELQAEENPLDAILDWLDDDDNARDNGAESDFYESLDPPYVCKNGPMDSIEELLLIPGITPELYFDLNRDPAERESLEEGQVWLSLPDLLTVNGDPQGRINVNTAQFEVLQAVVGAWGQGGDGLADRLWERQFENPCRTENDLEVELSLGTNTANGPGEGPPPQTMFTIKSDVFRIHGNGRCDDVLVRIEAFVARADYERILNQPPVSSTGDPFELLRFIDWRVIR